MPIRGNRFDLTHCGKQPSKIQRTDEKHGLIGHLTTPAGCLFLLFQRILLPVDEAETSGRTGSFFLVGVNVLSETPRLGLVDLHLSVNREHPGRDKKDGAPNDTVVDPSEHKGELAPFTGNVGVFQTIPWVGGIPAQPS